jgi:hypothetical protein
MWCVGALTEEYQSRMYGLLRLYARPHCQANPVVCIDEKSAQLLAHSRAPLAIRSGTPLREDYEYVRRGTCNLFVAVESQAGQRFVAVTAHRGKVEFVAFVRDLLERVYRSVRRVYLVLDNLNTHFRKVFEHVLGVEAASTLLKRVVFHYTPTHASWLHMAEIEIGELSRQCLDRRVPDMQSLVSEVNAWQRPRNTERRTIQWSFTRQDADQKLGRRYVSKSTC